MENNTAGVTQDIFASDGDGKHIFSDNRVLCR